MFVVGVNDAIWKILGICFMLCEIGHRLKTFLKALALHKNNISGRKVGNDYHPTDAWLQNPYSSTQ